MTRCSHGTRLEDRCNECFEEGMARANKAATQTPGPTAPVNVDGCSTSAQPERRAKMGVTIAPRIVQSNVNLNAYEEAEKKYRLAYKEYLYRLKLWQAENNIWVATMNPAHYQAQEKLWDEKEVAWDASKVAEKEFKLTPKELDTPPQSV